VTKESFEEEEEAKECSSQGEIIEKVLDDRFSSEKSPRDYIFSGNLSVEVSEPNQFEALEHHGIPLFDD